MDGERRRIRGGRVERGDGTVGRYWTGPGARSGTQTYSLPNSWTYTVGSYTTTLNYTLTAP